jgi:hypothetical protein
VAALIITVTKISVVQLDDGLYAITAHLNCKSGSTSVIDKDFTATYNSATPVAGPQSEIKNLMQAEIDKYKAAQAIYNSSALDSAISTIQSQLAG